MVMSQRWVISRNKGCICTIAGIKKSVTGICDSRKGLSMVVRLLVMVVLLTGVLRSGVAQTISFNTPLPWVSLRNDSLTVRAQVDTSALNGKKLSLKVHTIKNGRSKTIASKSFKVTDPSGEFSFGKLNKKLIGGEEFIQIAWKIAGTEDKGTIEPIGIADLTKLVNTDTVKVEKIGDDKSAKDAATAIGSKLATLGSVSYGMAWNKNALYVAVKKSAKDEVIKFGFDGKNGKNSFLSYPDRFLVCSPAADSEVVSGVHYERSLKKDAIEYTEKKWRSSISYEVVGDVIVAVVPWYDTGMIPFEERTVGFGAFVENAKGKDGAVLPEGADFFTPATWGTLLLQK